MSMRMIRLPVRCVLAVGQRVFSRPRRLALALVVTAAVWSTIYVLSDILFDVRDRWNANSELRETTSDEVHRRRQYHFEIGADNETIGTIWPAADEQHDRIRSQIDGITKYAEATKTRKRATKTILRVGDFNWYTWEPGQTWFKGCPVDQCSLTRDRRTSRSADALIITEVGYSARSYYLPKPRHQVWITQHWESPLHDRIDSAAVRGLINWTVSFRRDSTIPISYGRLYPQADGATNRTTRNFAAGKTKFVAWFVSNCNAWNYRQRYARELAKYIQVDIYGSCGDLSCPRSTEKSCLQLLSTDYKFYLAFENSNCDDYITEKLSYTALSHDVVPIVMGARREDYAAFAPTHSYIHVDDFAGTHQLADYLRLVAANDTLYNEYFRWKGAWKDVDQRYWCRVCALLHWRDDVDYVSWYDDYRSWWNGACDRNSSLPWFQQNSRGYAIYSLFLLLSLLILVTFSVAFTYFSDATSSSACNNRA